MKNFFLFLALLWTTVIYLFKEVLNPKEEE